jgi:hypothetical protein
MLFEILFREATMSLERVRRDQALTKSEFNRRLRAWPETNGDATIGPVDHDRRTGWVYVRSGSNVFRLNADTKRNAVDEYLKMVTLHGDELQWEIVASAKDKMTAVAYGPDRIHLPSFHLYTDVCAD